MGTLKPRRTPEEIEDIILRKIFLVTLTEPSSSSTETDPRVVYLQMTAAEILSEGSELRLCHDHLERVLIDRLTANFTTSEPPFPFLLSSYRRADSELKKISSMSDPILRSHMDSVVRQAKALALSYSLIHLANPNMFPDWDPSSPISPLLPLIFSQVAPPVDSYGGSDDSLCPHGFLDDFFRGSDFDTLDLVLKALYGDLRAMVMRVSILGNFQQPLRALMFLLRLPIGPKSLVTHQWWIPRGGFLNGREIEMASILGSFFHVSSIPDHLLFKSLPDVGDQLFSNPSNRHHSDIMSSFTTIETLAHTLTGGLADVLLLLLKNGDTRESVLHYLSEIINHNSSRSHIQVNPTSCASSGTFVTLSAVMLKLCEPFLDASPSKLEKIDPRYIAHGSRLNLSGMTALHASSEEVMEWAKRDDTKESVMENRFRPSQEASSSSQSGDRGEAALRNATGGGERSKYSFICECFFMTARVLNLGIIKALAELRHIIQEVSRCEEVIATIRETHGRSGSPQHLENDIARVTKEMDLYNQDKLCYEAHIAGDDEVVQGSLSYYRLMVIWLVKMVGGFRMPLPPRCPVEFACMPEHFIEDAMEQLMFVSRVPRALDTFPFVDDFMNFIIMFMASPNYITNPYLRAKMVDVLNIWIPGRSMRDLSSLFVGNQLAVDYLVRNLLKLYVDIEFTGSNTQFYDKFNIRHNISELLEYLWQVPSHRNVWTQIAKEEEKGVYLNFLNFLINDSIYLLDESLNKILELKEIEAEMSNMTEWERRPLSERHERTHVFRSQENLIKIDMKLANEDVSMLSFTSEHIFAPFLLPEMVERVGNMLNYFLLQLVGPQRKSLTLKDPEKYEFRPRQLLKQIVYMYVHLARGDSGNVFPAAISGDGRSYNEQLFSAAAEVLWKIGEDGRVIEEFVALGRKAKMAAAEAMEVEAVLGEIPDEFLDPIQYTLMKDPVMLPSSRVTVDRSVIQRHLLSDSTDPFSRSHLTVDMLISNTQLKGRIDEFVQSQGSKSRPHHHLI